jgi:putative acetyltransferase
MRIRAEQPQDKEAVYQLNQTAFGNDGEARLVELLHDQADPLISLVAEQGGCIVGHILFSPVTLADHPGLQLMGLAPMAVAPERQHQGVGSQLIEAGLEQCRQLGIKALVVLGHPDYYPRFGFKPAHSSYGIDSKYEVPDEVFMALELEPGALNSRTGRISYHPAFDQL